MVLGKDGEMGAEHEGTGETDIIRPGEEAADGEFRDTSRLQREDSIVDLKLMGSACDMSAPIISLYVCTEAAQSWVTGW